MSEKSNLDDLSGKEKIDRLKLPKMESGVNVSTTKSSSGIKALKHNELNSDVNIKQTYKGTIGKSERRRAFNIMNYKRDTNMKGKEQRNINDNIGVTLTLSNESILNGVPFPMFVEKLRNHVLKNFDEPRDILEVIENHVDPQEALIKNQPLVLTPLGNKSILARWIREREIKRHIKRVLTLDNNKERLYRIVWQQCSTALQKTIKLDDYFEEHNADLDCIWLLKQCKVHSNTIGDVNGKNLHSSCMNSLRASDSSNSKLVVAESLVGSVYNDVVAHATDQYQQYLQKMVLNNDTQVLMNSTLMSKSAEKSRYMYRYQDAEKEVMFECSRLSRYCYSRVQNEVLSPILVYFSQQHKSEYHIYNCTYEINNPKNQSTNFPIFLSKRFQPSSYTHCHSRVKIKGAWTAQDCSCIVKPIYSNPDLIFVDFSLEQLKCQLTTTKEHATKDATKEYQHAKIEERVEKQVEEQGEHKERNKQQNKNGAMMECKTSIRYQYTTIKERDKQGKQQQCKEQQHQDVTIMAKETCTTPIDNAFLRSNIIIANRASMITQYIALFVLGQF